MDYSPAGSSVHGVLQARILEWLAISFSTQKIIHPQVSSEEKSKELWEYTQGRFNLAWLSSKSFPETVALKVRNGLGQGRGFWGGGGIRRLLFREKKMCELHKERKTVTETERRSLKWEERVRWLQMQSQVTKLGFILKVKAVQGRVVSWGTKVIRSVPL